LQLPAQLALAIVNPQWAIRHISLLALPAITVSSHLKHPHLHRQLLQHGQSLPACNRLKSWLSVAVVAVEQISVAVVAVEESLREHFRSRLELYRHLWPEKVAQVETERTQHPVD
jgi:hypothetical protein